MKSWKYQPTGKFIGFKKAWLPCLLPMLITAPNNWAEEINLYRNKLFNTETQVLNIYKVSPKELSPNTRLIASYYLPADTTDKIYAFVEQMPVFPGGEAAQNKFILMNLRYPVEAMKAGLTGLVVAQFVVNKKGKIQDIGVVKSVSKELDEEVMRIVRLMPDFTPAKQNGQPVFFRYTLPVRFSLASNIPTNAILDTVNARIFTQAENPPQFPGGESALNAFIKKNLDYPKEAKKSKTEGLVVVQFLIDENGKLFYPKVTKSVNNTLDAEAMRLVSLLPAFVPAKQNGKPVVFRYTLPVRFDL